MDVVGLGAQLRRERTAATLIVIFLILVPFFAFRVLGEAVGERNLILVFFRPRGKI